MLLQEPTPEMLAEWNSLWTQYRDKLRPNRKTGPELLDYLCSKYTLTELQDQNAFDAVFLNVTKNEHLAEKLPEGAEPLPKTFFLENEGEGQIFYQPENKDPEAVWGGDITRIFVGIDLASGFYMVEGNSMLWDELYAFQGLDEKDLENPYCVAQYITCLKRFGMLQEVLQA